MEELINDGCDVNIAVDGIPLVLYASETGKVKSLDLILKKGLDWRKFIANCKEDGTIKKNEGSPSYSVKVRSKEKELPVNWLELAVDNEPSRLK